MECKIKFKPMKSVYVNVSQGYKGDHPIEHKHHYENLLAEMGIIEVGITDVEEIGHMIKISYHEY